MKTGIKRIVSSVLLVLVLVAAVPASLVSALDFDFDQVDWDALGDMLGLTEEQLEDLKETVENLDEEQLDEIIENATNAGSDAGETIVCNVAVIGDTTTYYTTLSEAIANAKASEVIFVMNESALADEVVDMSCKMIFNKDIDVSALRIAQDYATVKGSYVFGETTYPLYIISSVSETLASCVNSMNGVSTGYTAALEGENDQYTLTLTVDVDSAEDMVSNVSAIANDTAAAIIPAFPLFDNICVEGFELYDGEYFYMSAMDALVSDLLTKQNENGIYQMAYSDNNVLYSFPMTMEYHDGAYEVQMTVVVKVDATAEQLSSIKSAMKKTMARLYIEDLGDGKYTVQANATGLMKAIAEEVGYGAYYDLATEDGIRAFLDDCKIGWICEKIMAYNGAAYADVAEMMQKLVRRFMATEEYANAKDKTVSEAYAGNGVYTFTVDGKYDYSGMLKTVAKTSAVYGYDYAKLVAMCKGDTTVTRTVNCVVTAYSTTLEQSASDVVEGVLDALDEVSADTAYSIERTYTDGIISGINFVLNPGTALEIKDVVNKDNAFGVLESLVPVYLVFDKAAVNGNVVYDANGTVALRSALLNVYNSQPLNFTTVANMEGNTLLTYDLQLVYGDVVLNIPVSLSIATSDENLAKLKSAAKKMADIVTVDADLNGASLYLDITVDLRNDLESVLSLVMPSYLLSDYNLIREELHAWTLQELLDKADLKTMQAAAEKVGMTEQFNKLVEKLAARFGLDTSDPCNYEDVIAVLDANKYYQKYLKELLESKYAEYDIASILATTVGDYYRNDGTYTAQVGEAEDGVVLAPYIDRVLDALKTRFENQIDKADAILEKLGYASVDEMIEALRNRFSKAYNAKYDVDVKVTVILFDVYEVVFVDADGNEIDRQEVVAGNAAKNPTYHGGNTLNTNYTADQTYTNVLSDLVVTLTPIHVYESEVTTEPTCCTEGVTTYTCTVCGDSYTEAIEADPNAHDWAVLAEADSTCTAQGFTVKICMLCYELDISYTPAYGHELTLVSETLPTCEEDGELVYECVDCEETIVIVLPAFDGHAWSEWEVTTEATCVAEGEETRTCLRNGCGETETHKTEKDPDNHAELVWEVTSEATCTKDGEQAEYCNACENYTGNVKVIEATGHAWGEWEVTTEATCTEDGSKTRTCENGCGETETETIPAIGHNYVHQDGYNCCNPEADVCSNCGDKQNVVEVYKPTLKDDAEKVAFISGILVVKVEKMTVAEFKENFTGAITVYNLEGELLADDDYVGTKSTFVCDNCKTEFTIAVIGDVDGDGYVNLQDYMLIKLHVLQKIDLEGAQFAAANVNVDEEGVTLIDYMMVRLYLLQRYDFYSNVPDWDTISDLVLSRP